MTAVLDSKVRLSQHGTAQPGLCDASLYQCAAINPLMASQ